jgi:hypothetical protein
MEQWSKDMIIRHLNLPQLVSEAQHRYLNRAHLQTRSSVLLPGLSLARQVHVQYVHGELFVFEQSAVHAPISLKNREIVPVTLYFAPLLNSAQCCRSAFSSRNRKGSLQHHSLRSFSSVGKRPLPLIRTHTLLPFPLKLSCCK